MGLNDFILNCEKYNKQLEKDIEYYKNKSKRLEKKLQQSEEVIEECKQSIDNFMTHIDDGFCADMMTFIGILNKYKKEESE